MCTYTLSKNRYLYYMLKKSRVIFLYMIITELVLLLLLLLSTNYYYYYYYCMDAMRTCDDGIQFSCRGAGGGPNDPIARDGAMGSPIG